MSKQALKIVLLTLVLSVLETSLLFAQEDHSGEKDTFFLNRKSGLLGKLGKSITSGEPNTSPVETANPYRSKAGKSVRFIRVLSLGFERNINDTTIFKRNIGAIIANAFHKNTREKIIINNLFFREGSVINPYLLADNERHLRELTYIQDARILLADVAGSTDLVDVIVVTKDVFSIGGNISANGVKRANLGVREENFGGSGSKIGVSTYYERDRNPAIAYGAELIKRNIKGSFLDLTLGFQNYKNAFSSNRSEETYVYATLERPFVSQYIPLIGAIDVSVSKTMNAYVRDSIYKSDIRYKYVNSDVWVGYIFGKNKLLLENITAPLRKLIALRAFNLRFEQLPFRTQFVYDYRFADIGGVLVSFNLFKQKFYRTNFIYGFGRNEDVPEGFSAAVIGGWTEKQERSRLYYGLDLQHTHFNKNGFFTSYTFRAGAYNYKGTLEDIDLLMNVEHFTRLRKLNPMWYNRNFFTVGITRQINPQLNQPLFLRSDFGIPYFQNGGIEANLRATVRGETVFFNMKKIYGFRLAPFLFGDLSLVTPSDKSFAKSDLYSAVGAGIRTRNENLVFGTVELRGYYFPRAIESMHTFKVEVRTNIRFKYSSIFIRKPDFIRPN